MQYGYIYSLSVHAYVYVNMFDKEKRKAYAIGADETKISLFSICSCEVGVPHIFTLSIFALTFLTAPKMRRGTVVPKLPTASSSQYSVYSCMSFTPGC